MTHMPMIILKNLSTLVNCVSSFFDFFFSFPLFSLMLLSDWITSLLILGGELAAIAFVEFTLVPDILPLFPPLNNDSPLELSYSIYLDLIILLIDLYITIILNIYHLLCMLLLFCGMLFFITLSFLL